MQLYCECMHCILEHHWSLVKDCTDEPRRAAFMREVCKTVAEADPNMAAPVPTAKLQKLYVKMFAAQDDYPRLKRKYNELLLSWLPELREKLAAANDPLKLAVWMAMAGNYIDFGVLKEVDDARLRAMLATPDERAVNTPELENLRREARAAKKLTYACDNCGEIVLDMLLMEELKRENPGLEITALGRKRAQRRYYGGRRNRGDRAYCEDCGEWVEYRRYTEGISGRGSKTGADGSRRGDCQGTREF